MQRRLLVALSLSITACGGGNRRAAPAPATPAPAPAPVLIEGAIEPGRGPDGNSIFLEAPRGLVLVDTGRHPAHQEKLLAYARGAGKPIVAIVNTHWHLDHTGGNAEILAEYPEAEVVATTAIEGALVGFLAKGRARREAALASNDVPPDQKEDMRLDNGAVDAPQALRPTRPISSSGRVEIGGRTLDLHVAPYAATEADLWIYDDANRTVIAGDLVVDLVPFLDTACPSGWSKALGEIAATPFDRLIPGHGAPMTREQFATWRAAFDALLACAASDAKAEDCIGGWIRDAAAFIPASARTDVEESLRYYIEQRLRSAEAHDQFCPARES